MTRLPSLPAYSPGQTKIHTLRFWENFPKNEVVPLWHKNCAKPAQAYLQPVFVEIPEYLAIVFLGNFSQN